VHLASVDMVRLGLQPGLDGVYVTGQPPPGEVQELDELGNQPPFPAEVDYGRDLCLILLENHHIELDGQQSRLGSGIQSLQDPHQIFLAATGDGPVSIRSQRV